MRPRGPESDKAVASRTGKTRVSSSIGRAHVALLRGINVGGRNMLPMADLVRMFTRAGCERVQTYIQSGNVVFVVPGSVDVQAMTAAVGSQIARRFGFTPAIIVRSAAEMRRVAKGNPFVMPAIDVAMLHVGFLDIAPSGKIAAQLDPERSPGDRFIVRGREIYLHLGNGAGKTRLTGAYIESTLRATCTVRNWRTVLKLTDMAAAAGSVPAQP